MLKKYRNFKKNEWEDALQKDSIAAHFNDYFVNVNPTFAYNITDRDKTFESYIQDCAHKFVHTNLSFREFTEAYFSLQKNKTIGHD